MAPLIAALSGAALASCTPPERTDDVLEPTTTTARQAASERPWAGFEPEALEAAAATVTTTTERPVATTVRAARSGPEPAPVEATGTMRTIESSAYCLSGRMKNGEHVHDGAVASVVLAMGTSWKVLDGPLAGRVFTVEDTGGPQATFDVWMSSCQAAINYGRRDVTIEAA